MANESLKKAGFFGAAAVAGGILVLSVGSAFKDHSNTVHALICTEGQEGCVPCAGAPRGLLIEPIEVLCNFDKDRGACTNKTSQVRIRVDTFDPELYKARLQMTVTDKSDTINPAFEFEPQTVKVGGKSAKSAKPRPDFLGQNLVKYQYKLELTQDGEVVACVDPEIFIHDAPGAGP